MQAAKCACLWGKLIGITQNVEGIHNHISRKAVVQVDTDHLLYLVDSVKQCAPMNMQQVTDHALIFRIGDVVIERGKQFLIPPFGAPGKFQQGRETK